MPQCTHQDQIKTFSAKTEGCEECLAMNDNWVSLRLCLFCGHVGCCNNSKNKHAQKHFAQTNHAVIQAYALDDNWKWCYIDKVYVGKKPNPFKFIKHVISTKLRAFASLIKKEK